MRVVVPRTREIPEVSAALSEVWHAWEPVNLDHPEHYFELLTELWDDGGDFVIVEHDIVIHDGVIPGFLHCKNDWCAHPYDYLDGYHYGLGCTRFTADLIARHPHAMARVGEMSDDMHPPRHYCRLDGWLAHVLLTEHESMCQHWPRVAHLQANPGHSGHGCI